MEYHGPAAALACLGAGHLIAFMMFRDLRAAGIAAVTERAPIRQNIREYLTELGANRLLLLLLLVTASVEIFGFSFATALPEIATGRRPRRRGIGVAAGTRRLQASSQDSCSRRLACATAPACCTSAS